MKILSIDKLGLVVEKVWVFAKEYIDFNIVIRKYFHNGKIWLLNYKGRRYKIMRKSLKEKAGGAVTSFAKQVTSANVNSACNFLVYQDKIPAEAKKLRKF